MKNKMSKLTRMKRILLILFIILPSALVSEARDFEYTYEGKTLTYTVIDEESKTCETKAGRGYFGSEGYWIDYYMAGNEV